MRSAVANKSRVAVQMPADSGAQYIDTDDALRQACRQWSASPVLALDTEFIRERTFYAKPALLQINDGQHIGLIDPLRIKDWKPLAEQISDPGVIKVAHACREDLEVLDQMMGTLPDPLFDTQLASGLQGMTRDLGYGEMVSRMLDISLDKSQSRTDWLKRPLSELQLQYAAKDVEYLPEIYRMQREALEGLGRLDWLREDCEGELARARGREAPDRYYQRVFAQLPMHESSLALLKKLSRWREDRVREIDIPRPWLLTDKQLRSVVKQRPNSRQALLALLGSSRKSGAVRALLNIVAAAGAPPEQGSTMRGAPRERVDAMLKRVTKIAKESGLEPTVLATRGECTELLVGHLNDRDAIWPERLRGWRRGLLGDDLPETMP